MIKDKIHKAISAKQKEIKEWFSSQRGSDIHLPFYSSFDIRDSGFKVVPVDANLFPAGFNNICQTDKDSAVDLVKSYFTDHYPAEFQKVLLLSEEHTKNPYYWDNIYTLLSLLEQAGKDVRIAIPRELPEPLHLTSASGFEVTVFGAKREGNGLNVEGFHPDVIICNNDFSEKYEVWSEGLQTPMNPPSEMGWYQRRKSDFFTSYNELAEEFARIIDIDPWWVQVETLLFKELNINDEQSREQLALKVEDSLTGLREQYKTHGVTEDPFVFVKNNSGTYGLGVTKVASADEIRNWSYKARKKMKAAKGGGGFSEVIVQEGVPTTVQSEGSTAEPSIYMIGCQLAGGFLRTHHQKGPADSLNSPGAVFKRLCVSDLNINVEGHPMENVYGWIGKLGFLAIAKEAKAHGVRLKEYR